MTRSKIPAPNPSSQMTLDALARFQSIAGRHISFSLTLACPLHCDHCIVQAGPGRGDSTISEADARAYASQMDDLYAHGIRNISFTGGEPLLARVPLRVLSEAAAGAGIASGLVTSGYWATSASTARRVVEAFPSVQCWDFSLDVYHERFVSIDRVRLAYETAKGLGRQGMLRFTYHDPITSEEDRMLDQIASFAAESDLMSQRVRRVGRAEELPLSEANQARRSIRPCVTQGIVIRGDGSIGPCCLNLVESRDHPFQLPDARSRPLAEIHAEYMSLPLLQMIRAIGFSDAVQWLVEAGMIADSDLPLPTDTCDLCVRLLTRPPMGEYLARRASTPENRLRIAVISSRILGEHYLLQRTVRELEGMTPRIEGFEGVAALAAETEAARMETTAGACC